MIYVVYHPEKDKVLALIKSAPDGPWHPRWVEDTPEIRDSVFFVAGCNVDPLLNSRHGSVVEDRFTDIIAVFLSTNRIWDDVILVPTIDEAYETYDYTQAVRF